MIIVTSTLSLPTGVFIYTTFINALPKELNESAEIDGCTGINAFWKIIFPLLKPATAAFVILNGFGIWNNYAQAVFFLQSNDKHNVPQALLVFFSTICRSKMALGISNSCYCNITCRNNFYDISEAIHRWFIRRSSQGMITNIYSDIAIYKLIDDVNLIVQSEDEIKGAIIEFTV